MKQLRFPLDIQSLS